MHRVGAFDEWSRVVAGDRQSEISESQVFDLSEPNGEVLDFGHEILIRLHM